MSWTKCMQDKIISHYGEEVKECVKGITKGDIDDIVKCMATVLDISDPDVWIPEQIALLTEWSVECAF